MSGSVTKGLSRAGKFLLIIGVTLYVLWISLFMSRFTVDTDFPVFYYAANTVLDQNSSVNSVYEIDTANKYSMPQTLRDTYIYSLPAAYLLSPLALMPYYEAKAVMIFLNILAYIAALALLLRADKASGRRLIYPLVLSCLWLPFIQNMRAAQVNAVLLLLLVLAALLASRNRPAFSGVFLGISVLFKLFPIGIAMVLGLKEWRILVFCLLTVGVSFLIPGSTAWLSAAGKVYKDYTLAYLFLSQWGDLWFWLYAASIAGATAVIVYRSKESNYLLFISFAIPAVFLTMPVIEYHHLTLLAFSFAYLFTFSHKAKNLLIIVMCSSIILISAAFFFNHLSLHFVVRPVLSSTLVFFGLLLIWAAMGWRIWTGSLPEGPEEMEDKGIRSPV
jgi:hypothetical protein